MGELHLEIIVDRMKREFKVEANVGAPQVAYRETITRRADVDYTHKKQTGGSGQFARVKLTFEPGEKGSGLRVREQGGRRVGAQGVHPGRRRRASNSAIADRRASPASRWSTCVAQLVDGAYHEVDSSALAFEIAARARRSRRASPRPARCCSSR